MSLAAHLGDVEVVHYLITRGARVDLSASRKAFEGFSGPSYGVVIDGLYKGRATHQKLNIDLRVRPVGQIFDLAIKLIRKILPFWKIVSMEF
jgi:hypothetical protein